MLRSGFIIQIAFLEIIIISDCRRRRRRIHNNDDDDDKRSLRNVLINKFEIFLLENPRAH